MDKDKKRKEKIRTIETTGILVEKMIFEILSGRKEFNCLTILQLKDASHTLSVYIRNTLFYIEENGMKEMIKYEDLYQPEYWCNILKDKFINEEKKIN